MVDRLNAKSRPVEAKATEPKATEQQPEESHEPEAKAAESDPDDDLMTDGVKEPKTESLVVNSPAETPKEGDAKAGKQKINPWKLADEHKARAAALEKEVLELKKLGVSAEARKAEIAEMEAVKQKAKELEDHIRFVDYQASDEYKQKYEKPYEQQWVTAMKELKGVTMTDGQGDSREIAPQDLLDLVNMPLAKARQVANETFGDFADDVMQHRSEIRRLYEARSEALANAKKEGVEKSQTFQKQSQEKTEALTTEVRSVYEKAVNAFSSDPKMAEFFKPIDGDDDANTALEKGYAMVERAFSVNPLDPNLTPEQRASIVKLHAAVRHRSAGFGRARYLLAKERAAHQATLKKLQQYESTVPNRGGGTPAAPGLPAGGSKLEQMQSRLAQRASKR